MFGAEVGGFYSIGDINSNHLVSQIRYPWDVGPRCAPGWSLSWPSCERSRSLDLDSLSALQGEREREGGGAARAKWWRVAPSCVWSRRRGRARESFLSPHLLSPPGRRGGNMRGAKNTAWKAWGGVRDRMSNQLGRRPAERMVQASKSSMDGVMDDLKNHEHDNHDNTNTTINDTSNTTSNHNTLAWCRWS